jgi:2-haloacid dehalogenase
MDSSLQAIVFDFGGVLVGWDPHRFFRKCFSNDIQTANNFLFAQGVTELSTQFPQYAHIIRTYDVLWEDSITGTILGTVELLHSAAAVVIGFRLEHQVFVAALLDS